MRTWQTAFLLSTVAIPGVALAQASTDQPQAEGESVGLAEIIVTAQRRSESLQKVPLAVSAFDAKALETKGLTNLNNLSASVSPGVVVAQFAGTPSTLAFNIRGAYSSDPGIGLAEQGVAVYADGVPLGRASGTGIELGDIERIEILRGPQGTLFGRNAEGGAVQFVTRRPTGEAGGKIEAGIGNFNSKRVMAQIELPKFANISIKLGGLINKRDGFTNNIAARPGIDFLSPNAALPKAVLNPSKGSNLQNLGLQDQRGFRIGVQWEPSPDFNAYYTYDYSDLDYTILYSARTGGRVPSSYAWCRDPRYAATCASGASIAANVFYGSQGPEGDIVPKYTSVPLFTPLNNSKVRGHGLTLDWHPSDSLQIKSITGRRSLKENNGSNLGLSQVFVQTVPTSAFGSPTAPAGSLIAFTGTYAAATIDQNQFSQELQVIGDLGDLKFTTGLFYYHERVFDTRGSAFSVAYQLNETATDARPIAINPFDLSGVSAVDGLPNSYQLYKGVANSYAAYAQATYTPSSVLDGRLSLTAGLRYTRDKKEFTRLRAAAGSGGSNTSKFDQDRFDPAFTLAFQATPDINLYARYARAYRAGGTGIRNKLALSTYKPEVNTTWEAGLKSQLLDNRVRFNLAAYHSTIKDTQVSFQNSALDPSSTDTINIKNGNVKIRGIEVELNVAATRELAFNVGYSFMSPKLSGFVAGPVNLGNGQFGNFSAPFVFAPYVPRHQLAIAGDYQREIGDDGVKVFAHAEYNYMSPQHNEPASKLSQFVREPLRSLSQANARVGLRDIPIGSTTMDFTVWGNNLFDKRDISYGYMIGATDFTIQPGQEGGAAYGTNPRTYGVQAKIQF
ncbi:TonB-dependent receptor [Novosphingobium taihuense]|uniref:Iron complex outermembrane receptor protein n=1 Tax=Novosphingobium taihuense TaxID=260085 RepID=A0A7W7ABY4_9SPHN|nr:TonB-dependent receptor [Novosphingobium taihuense]MBB4614203.1 iron complex outermembrane receptor protein [Novosphingobium taihuense]TWH87052.1 iron complex outermembrane receptor protein [Novosphingobium taihuense]